MRKETIYVWEKNMNFSAERKREKEKRERKENDLVVVEKEQWKGEWVTRKGESWSRLSHFSLSPFSLSHNGSVSRSESNIVSGYHSFLFLTMISYITTCCFLLFTVTLFSPSQILCLMQTLQEDDVFLVDGEWEEDERQPRKKFWLVSISFYSLNKNKRFWSNYSGCMCFEKERIERWWKKSYR